MSEKLVLTLSRSISRRGWGVFVLGGMIVILGIIFSHSAVLIAAGMLFIGFGIGTAFGAAGQLDHSQEEVDNRQQTNSNN